MIRSELDEKNCGCNVKIAGCYKELSIELNSLFEGLSKRDDTKDMLLTVIDRYLGKEIKGIADCQ